MSANRILHLATARGVFRARLNGGAAEVAPAGLEGKGIVRWLAVDADDPARLYAATDRAGVWRSDDGGRSWAEKSEGLVYRQVYSLAQHAGTGALYAGTEPAAVFVSRDRAETWQELETLRRLPSRKDWTFPGPPYIPHVRGLAVSAADPAVVFGAVEEGWLIRTRDGGATWQNLKDDTEFDSHTVTLLPHDPRIVLATSGKGIYRSADGGESFAEVSRDLSHRYLTHIAVNAARPGVLFTAGAEVPPPYWGRPGGPGMAFYRSEDSGLTWRRCERGFAEPPTAAPRAVAGDPEAPDTVYVGLHDGELWMTPDGGESFRRIASGLPPIYGVRAGQG